MRLSLPLLALSLVPFANRLTAQAPGADHVVPPIRSAGRADASILAGTVMEPSTRTLSSGRILLSDMLNRRLIAIDADLRKIDTLFDANTPAPLTFPQSPVQLIAALADTTLMFESSARGFRVIDPEGRVVRRLGVMDNNLLRGLANPGSSGKVDPRGRLVYTQARSALERPTVVGVQPQPDSVMLTRISFDRPGWDSLAALMGNGSRIVADSTRPRAWIATLPVVDVGEAWAITSGGTIAIIRESDFHVDWIAPDGSRRSSPPPAWPWHTYTQGEKDSLRAERQQMLASTSQRVVGGNGAMPAPPVTTRLADSIPARAPAFAPFSARGDLDGRIWIILGSRIRGIMTPGPVVYGIIDSTGQVVDRIEFPEHRIVMGFGPGGSIYAVTPTMTREGYAIERYHYRKP